MTGQHIAGTPDTIGDNQPAIDWILGRYFGEASERAEKPERTGDAEPLISLMTLKSLNTPVSLLSLKPLRFPLSR